MNKKAGLRALEQAVKADDDDKVADAIVAARLAGRTWQDIADVLGIPRSSAMRRYREITGDIKIRPSIEDWEKIAEAWAAEYPGHLPTRSAVWFDEDGRRWNIGAWLADQRRGAKGDWQQPERNRQVLERLFGSDWADQAGGHARKPPRMSDEQLARAAKHRNH